MADRLPAIDSSLPLGQRFPVIVREEIAAVAATGVTGVTKASIGLGNVDNTADADKPVSTATAAALAAKANKITDPWKLYASDGTGELVAKSYSNAPAGGTIAERNSSGSLSVGTPDYADAATPKSYVDALVGTIVAGDLADGAVTTVKIADGNVTSAKLADGAVTSAKILDGTIATADLADGAVTSAKIADGTVALADLAASVQTSLGKADAALVGVSGITGVWMGASGSLPATGEANVLYVVSG